MVAVSVLLAATATLHGEPEEKSKTDSPNPIEHHVQIEDMKFEPASITVEIGDSVVFENHDLFPHTVTSEKAGEFDSGAIAAGKSWRLTPRAAGALTFRCTFHPVMEGRVTVAPKRARPASPAPTGH